MVVCTRGFFNVCVCVCGVGFVMCVVCVYVCVCGGGVCNLCECVCVGFVICGCLYVWVL